jgi:glyoxylase-like metal-dependent hydrolase (beta-lactamase superfamily II)
MGWSTTVVSPPDGDMRAYMASLRRLLARGERRMWPTHGPSIDDPRPHLAALIEHREERERQIFECLRQGIGDIPAMVVRMYADVDTGLHFAAARSVLAHLIHLVETGRARADRFPEIDARFSPSDD